MTVESQLEDAIRGLLDARGVGVSVSTVEAAKKVGGPRWRSLTIPARRAAHRMMQTGELEITHTKGTVDVLRANLPVRVRRPS